MHELHLQEACLTPDWAKLHTMQFCFGVEDVARTYEANMILANGILMLPGYSFMSGGQWQSCSTVTARKILGTLNPTAEEFEKKHEEMNRIAAALRQDMIKAQKPDAVMRSFLSASHNIEVFSFEYIPLHGWLHAVLQNAIIQAWTAFEVLAEDLHLSVRQAYSMNFNSDRVFSKYYFQKRDKLRSSYGKAFEDDPDINAALGCPRIDELSLLRNLIVHKRGVVDGKFKEDCEKATLFTYCTAQNTALLKEWALLPVGHEFLFDGLLIRTVLDGSQEAAYQLLSTVDKWIPLHTPA